jgi:hypothetical protein
MDFRHINIGQLIKSKVAEDNLEIVRICNFLKCTGEKVEEMYNCENINADLLLRWSKLLKYDFFRIYSQHLILYAPSESNSKRKKQETLIPQFRKSLYTKEIIEFILGRINSQEMTKKEVIEYYRIPKSTLCKWIVKYSVGHSSKKVNR